MSKFLFVGFLILSLCTCRQVPTMDTHNIDDPYNNSAIVPYPISFSAYKMSTNYYQLTWETTLGYTSGFEIQIRLYPEDEFKDYLNLDGFNRGVKTNDPFTNNPVFRIRSYIVQPGNPSIYSEWRENS